MGLLDIFRKKKKEEKKEDYIAICVVCNKPIYKNDQYKKIRFQGKDLYMHKKCFRELKKMARQFIRSGNIPI